MLGSDFDMLQNEEINTKKQNKTHTIYEQCIRNKQIQI